MPPSPRSGRRSKSCRRRSPPPGSDRRGILLCSTDWTGRLALDFFTLFVDGSYTLKDQNGIGVPVFTFRANDHTAVRQAFHGMYVELQVRIDLKGQIAYALGVPDRGVTPWTIAIDPDHRSAISQGAREVGVMTYVQCPGPKTIDLNEFGADLEHDWSGRCARANDALAASKLDEAEPLFTELVEENPERLPIAHHGLGRCHRARNRLPEAIACYRKAALMAHRRRNKLLLPSAAAILSDMGVAYKKLGDYPRANCCLTWALSLRPNHTEALATFATLFKQSDALLVNVCARIFAVGRDKRAEQLAAGYATEYKQDPAKLIQMARWAAKDVDLALWPHAIKPEELTAEKFLAALDSASGEPVAPAFTMPEPPPPPPPLPAKVEPPVAEAKPAPAPEAKPAAPPPKAEPAPAPEPEKKAKKRWWKVW